jgi:hypothetical protein
VDYFVIGSTNQLRSGFLMVGWTCSGSTFTDVSTPDLNGTTQGISFDVDINTNNVRILAVVTSGTWNVKIGTKIIF